MNVTGNTKGSSNHGIDVGGRIKLSGSWNETNGNWSGEWAVLTYSSNHSTLRRLYIQATPARNNLDGAYVGTDNTDLGSVIIRGTLIPSISRSEVQ